MLVLVALWIRNGMAESAEFEHQQQEAQLKTAKAPAGRRSPAPSPRRILLIIALRLCELLTMYIVTAFALNYSTQNLGLPRELFLNIGLLVGGISCLTIPCFARLADRFTPADLHYRCAHRHAQRVPVLYGAGKPVVLLDPLLP